MSRRLKEHIKGDQIYKYVFIKKETSGKNESERQDYGMQRENDPNLTQKPSNLLAPSLRSPYRLPIPQHSRMLRVRPDGVERYLFHPAIEDYTLVRGWSWNSNREVCPFRLLAFRMRKVIIICSCVFGECDLTSHPSPINDVVSI